MGSEDIQKARVLLSGIMHPESGKNIVESGIVENISVIKDSFSINLTFEKERDPFANSLRRQVKETLETAFPEMRDKVIVSIKESAAKPKPQHPKSAPSTTGKIKAILAISSAKGGVGKSTVTANLAVTLASMGFKTGILDADIYGPSQPKMFGVEDYQPPVEFSEGREEMTPAVSNGVKLMSIGFFIDPNDALVWRGPMANSALNQMIHQTAWGELDFLLIDMPPGTGDIHLTILHELKVNGAIIVSTPQQIAVADVVRGIRMFRSPSIDVPVLGIIENMAWFTPAELPNNKYYIFGKGGAAALAKKEDIPLLGEIPLIQSVMEGGENGKPDAALSGATNNHYKIIAAHIVNNLK